MSFVCIFSDVATSGRFSVPEGLSEYMTVCNRGEKPLMVLYFLTQLKFERVLCFASTLEATHRYCAFTCSFHVVLPIATNGTKV